MDSNEYARKHHLSHIYTESLAALLEKLPSRPYDALAAGFSEVSLRLSRNFSVEELPIRDIFRAAAEHTTAEDIKAAGEAPNFEVPEDQVDVGGAFVAAASMRGSRICSNAAWLCECRVIPAAGKGRTAPSLGGQSKDG